MGAFCDAVMGAALGPEPDAKFARCGAMLTDVVRVRTGVLLLRLRYLLKEATDEFAEEVVLAAFERREGALRWIERFDRAALDLLDRARPTGNLAAGERSQHVTWALDLLGRDAEWYGPIVEWRVRQLQESHNRLRSMVKAAKLTIEPRTPPDVLGCYVFVPGAPSGNVTR